MKFNHGPRAFRQILGFAFILCLAGSLRSASAASGLTPAGRKAICSANLQSDVGARRSLSELVAEHRAEIALGKRKPPRELPMVFEGGPADRDLYNSAGEFETKYQNRDSTIFIGREESAKSEIDMRVAFYLKIGKGKYRYLNGQPGVPDLKLQDPFVAKIFTRRADGTQIEETILGGVKVWPVRVNGEEQIRYATVFYRDFGKGIEHLEPFLAGPDGMKDVRFVQSLDRKRITVFTRPQSDPKMPELGGRGKVGMFTVGSLDEITAAKITDAPIFRHQFFDSEWGGANAAVYLDAQHVGVIGHYARFAENGFRDYVGVSWIVNVKTGLISKPKLIIERADLVGGIERGAKREDLKNVLFPSGFRRNTDGTYTVWGGEGDQKTFQIVIENPF
jgi:hypothetical protein